MINYCSFSILAGGSEKFQDKQAFFYSELKSHHLKQSRHEIAVKVDRFELLESVRLAIFGIIHILLTCLMFPSPEVFHE